MTQLSELAKPFPARDISTKPGGAGGDYVKHSTVTEKLLYVVGPFSTHVEQVIYDGDELTGVLLTLTVEIDGRTVSVTEAGDNENRMATTNGARLKDAMSDAIKRAAMRLGCGLHLWSQDSYRLDTALSKIAAVESDSRPGMSGSSGGGEAVPVVESSPDPSGTPGPSAPGGANPVEKARQAVKR